jgi:hypothetical protein
MNEHFKMSLCTNTDDDGGDDYYAWQMAQKYHTMGSNFPVFGMGKLRWLHPADPSIGLGFVVIKTAYPTGGVSLATRNVFIDM